MGMEFPLGVGIPWESHGNWTKIKCSGTEMGTTPMGMGMIPIPTGISFPCTNIKRSTNDLTILEKIELGIQRNELSDYVNTKVSKEVDIIQFWQQNRSVLLKLVIIACRVLCLSSVSERVFNTAGRLLETRQTNMSPDSTNSYYFCTVICRNDFL